MNDLRKAWEMGSQANLFLLRSIEERHLGDRYAKRVRPIAAQFAHMHNTRLRWLTHAAPDLAAQVAQFPRGSELTKDDLLSALAASAEVVGTYLEMCEADGFVEHWNGPPASFMAYLVAHEAHHRGLVMAALRACGHRAPDDVIQGLWDWEALYQNR